MKSLLELLEIIFRFLGNQISILKLENLMEKLRTAVFGNLLVAGTLPMKGGCHHTRRSKEARVWSVKADVARIGSV